jgi:hypothetical protein
MDCVSSERGERDEPPTRPSGRLRAATNKFRRRIETEILVSQARLRAADMLADAVEASEAIQPPEVRAALRGYRAAAAP